MADARTGRASSALVWAVAAICVAVELFLTLSDRGLIGFGVNRWQAFAYLAYWPASAAAGTAYPLQTIATLFTYAFLHGDPIHLAVNMLTLSWIGPIVANRMGGTWFLAVFLATAAAGAAAFGLFGGGAPMVGASGALFGLVGCLIGWATRARWRRGAALRPVAEAILVLALLNVLLYVAVSGALAWQAHAGGFAAGLVISMVFRPRRSGRQSSDD